MCEIDTEKPRNTDLHIFSYMPHQYALNSDNQGVVVVLVNVAMHWTRTHGTSQTDKPARILTYWNDRHYQSVSIEQSRWFRTDVSAEVLKQKLLFFSQFLLSRHVEWEYKQEKNDIRILVDRRPYISVFRGGHCVGTHLLPFSVRVFCIVEFPFKTLIFQILQLYSQQLFTENLMLNVTAHHKTEDNYFTSYIPPATKKS